MTKKDTPAEYKHVNEERDEVDPNDLAEEVVDEDDNDKNDENEDTPAEYKHVNEERDEVDPNDLAEEVVDLVTTMKK